MFNIIITQLFTQLQSRHHTHSVVQLRDRTIVKVGRCHSDITQLRHFEDKHIFRFLRVVPLALIASFKQFLFFAAGSEPVVFS